MTTQQQIDIEFDSLARENDSPKLIANSKATGGTLLSVIKEQLSTCGSFDFCVAFVADGGLQILVETFQELKQRGIKGRLLTSTYLNFNSPDAFRKLLEYDNMEVRVFQGNLHAKGYIFDKGETSTVIVGSSNMTQTALTCNKEWNVLYQTVENSRLLGELRGEFNSLWNDTSTVLLSQDWIENYAAYRSAHPSKPKSKPTFQATVSPTTNDLEVIKPNKMQQRALEALGVIHRKGETRALLVSATGTGKTFLSAFDVLATKPRRILFLAHRRRIIDASRVSYEQLLGSTYTFDTYQTGKNISNATCVFAMCSSVAKHLSGFRPDEFDYIVIDEAHRSVFGKYGAIFQYFDSLLIGLTATPRAEIDKNTFQLLELENEPNFEYTYEEAIRDEYLRPYRLKKCNSKMINRGIKYDDLSAEQREQLEKVWEYEKAMKGIPKEKEYHRDIQGNEIFNYLINDDTIDNVLLELMTNGLKVHSGEDVGKTIIFAYNHKHAERIVERFNQLYPERGADYCQLIDNQVKNHSAIIADFKMEAKMPQIAVSVDMLDTGIDVPEILNLVFFKIIKSKIKFEQMIGRGTRLCKDLFGPGEDKQEFYIFDWCGNFDFFSKQGDDIHPSDSKSLTDRLFCLRLDIAKELQSAEHQEKEFDKQLHDELKTLLHQQVAAIGKERKEARPWLNIIEPYRNQEKWTCLSELDVSRLKKIGHLIKVDKDDEEAKRFDIVMLHIMLSLIDTTRRVGQFRKVVVNIAAILEKKASIPAVMERIDIIRKVQKPVFWENESLDALEHVRRELRGLVHLLKEQRGGKKFIIDIEDTYTKVEGVEDEVIKTSYKQRVIDYLAENSNNDTLRKIQHFEQLTSADIEELERIFFEELGTKDEYNELTEGHPYKNNVAAFIRVINGIDRKKALQIYQQFIEGYNLTSEQELYLKNILDYISMNGDIETRNFLEYPLKDLKWRETFGDTFVNLKDFIKQMHRVIIA